VALLNAAAALAAESGDFPASLQEAVQSLESGAALSRLDGLVILSQQLAQSQPSLMQ